jgi:oxygen-independent coproporphyrinogen-3 oxidase
MRHLYVHIPFCRSRCSYCDFASEPVGPHLRAGRVETYVERLLAEAQERLGAEGRNGGAGRRAHACSEGLTTDVDADVDADVDVLAGRRLETVYIGGGTPTVLPEDLLLGLVGGLACLQEAVPGRELTIEANPGTIGAHLLCRLKEAGVTRLSLGIQSFSAECRAALGRRGSQREIEGALRLIAGSATARGLGADVGTGSVPVDATEADARLSEWNLDLVFGIPGQTWATAAADIDRAIAARPTHISLYDLTYTPAFAARVARTRGAGAQRAAAAFAEEYLPAAAERLQAAGYTRYEVSNFALPGHECRHNQAYWRGEDYLGVGAGAVSTIGTERRTNPASVVRYLECEAASVEILTPRIRLWEKAMLGLRTAEGVDESEVLPVLDLDTRDRFLVRGLLTRGCGRLRLNPAFLDVSNAVISALLVAPEEP